MVGHSINFISLRLCIFTLVLSFGTRACKKKQEDEENSAASASRSISVQIDENATPGDRILIAKSGNNYQVGLVGIGVIEAGTFPPGFALKYPHHQVLDGAAYTDHNPYYWLSGQLESSSKSKTKEIKVKVSSQIWDAASSALVPIPVWLIQKVTNSLKLWESVPETGLYFTMAGTFDATGSLPKGTVAEPLITIDFTKYGEASFTGGLGGLGTFNEAPNKESIPDSYSGGRVSINMQSYYSNDYQTDLYYHNTFYRILVHEIGHALGLEHAATNSSVMTCGTSAIGDTNDYLFLSEQDKADITGLWNSTAANAYSISGTLSDTSHQGFFMIYAINTTTGKTFSSLTDRKYRIYIREPGQYAVVVKNDDHTSSYLPSYRPTWYVSGTAGSLDPAKASTVTLDGSSKHVTGIDITPTKLKAMFNLFLGFLPTVGTAEAGQALLRPGESKTIKLLLENASVNTGAVKLKTFGSSPDYTIQ